MTGTLSKNSIFIAFMLLLTALIVIDPSYAADTSAGFGKIDSVLDSIVTTLTGGTARLIAIICVIGVGIAWMYGIFDLRKAAFVIIGIGIVFGAPSLVSKFIG
ncbi:TrbC/VirB2 family protein [Bartonella pachyuromydis]|uniref:TrbC/VirB2 family protein n=1 Tax=Bartonella pachyuromydis TaxID=931097 RepID=A0ABP8VJL8_9HYPH